MTDLTKKRFAQLGQQLQLDQLSAVRKQAEGWRNGLAGLTGLVGVVFVLKGRESVAGLPAAWRWCTAALLVSAFALLLAGALRAVRAAHGQLGAQTWLTGDRLFTAVLDEVERTQDALTTARRCSVAGLCAIVAAIAVSWTVPLDEPKEKEGKGPVGRGAASYVLVETRHGTRCGQFVASDDRGVLLVSKKAAGSDGPSRQRIPADEVRSVTAVPRC
ncbi:hypothetical protein ABZV77_41710 [Streptomyces sp. NPDC004732]|uniref:hypothetical protein n=1 Tax=Streptomyces sp. NPDC004732 TaxID=3154290 RepID=UPI0033AED9B2